MMKNIVIAINYVNYRDELKAKLQHNALSLLDKIKPPNVSFFSFNYPGEKVDLPKSFRLCANLERNSKKEINNHRPLPYIKEIYNKCSKIPCDIFGYINSDILLKPNFFNIFTEQDKAVYIFGRFDLKHPVSNKAFLNGDYKIVNDAHPGFDGIFFRRKWWQKNKGSFHPDLILGEPEWDFYYYGQIRKLIKPKNRVEERILFHVDHPTIWNLTSPGSKSNQKINREG